MSLKINDLTWEQFRDRVPSSCDLAIVPVGTIEAHGAIPLGTDTLIPEALAEDLAPRLNALIAPSVAYGVTNSLLPFPGSTTVSSATFSAYLFEAAAGLVDAGKGRALMPWWRAKRRTLTARAPSTSSGAIARIIAVSSTPACPEIFPG